MPIPVRSRAASFIHRLRRGLSSPALLVAVVALGVALGPNVWAAASAKVSAKGIANNAVLSRHIKNGNVTALDLKRGSVTAAKIASGAVGSSQVGTNALLAEDLAADSVGADELAASAAPAAAIAAGAVGTEELAAASVTSGKLAIDAVTTSAIADGAVTSAKLAADSVTNGAIASAAVGADELGSDSVISSAIKDGAVTNQKLGNAYGAQLTFNMSIPDNAPGTSVVANDLVDPSNMFTNGDDFIELPTGGLWQICFTAKWASNAVGVREFYIFNIDQQDLGAMSPAHPSSQTSQSACGLVNQSFPLMIHFSAFQNSPGPLNVHGMITIVRLSDTL